MTLLLLQVATVLLVTLVCGELARRMGQARVVGEIVGGIVLGPSVLGRLSPSFSHRLFPAASLHAIELLSTVGLVLFLFTVGLEVDNEQLQRQKRTALAASATSILAPFLAAGVLAHPLRQHFSPHGIGSMPFVLFLGISMSITAFPVLARILEERNLTQTPLGATAVICAAFDDVTAWMLLAIALTLLDAEQGAGSLLLRFGVLAAYLALMLAVVRPLAAWLARRRRGDEMSFALLAVAIAGAFFSAAATEWAGVHPLFGAFIAGLCFPRVATWQNAIRMRLDMITSVLLLPLFFALTGLRTRLDLLNDPGIWGWTAIVVAGAAAGKMGGAMLAARWTGHSWRMAGALGALLNTRGLVELVVLNIAYNAGVFTPTLFTMLVVMALVTTMCTAPLLNLLRVRGPERAAVA